MIWDTMTPMWRHCYDKWEHLIRVDEVGPNGSLAFDTIIFGIDLQQYLIRSTQDNHDVISFIGNIQYKGFCPHEANKLNQCRHATMSN